MYFLDDPLTTRGLVRNSSFDVWLPWSTPWSLTQPHHVPYTRPRCGGRLFRPVAKYGGRCGTISRQLAAGTPLLRAPHSPTVLPLPFRVGIRASVLPPLSGGQVPKRREPRGLLTKESKACRTFTLKGRMC